MYPYMAMAQLGLVGGALSFHSQRSVTNLYTYIQRAVYVLMYRILRRIIPRRDGTLRLRVEGPSDGQK